MQHAVLGKGTYPQQWLSWTVNSQRKRINTPKKTPNRKILITACRGTHGRRVIFAENSPPETHDSQGIIPSTCLIALLWWETMITSVQQNLLTRTKQSGDDTARSPKSQELLRGLQQRDYCWMGLKRILVRPLCAALAKRQRQQRSPCLGAKAVVDTSVLQ